MISKTRFMNLIRCPRYAALEEIYFNKEKAIVDFDLDDLLKEENEAKKNSLLGEMFDPETNEDLIEVRNDQLETLLPYYNYIEMLSAQAIKNHFGDNVIYSLDTYKQKKFSAFVEDYEYYCFLDGYQETEKGFRVFESKATTSRKFLDLSFKEEKVEYSIFDSSPEGVLMLREDLLLPLINSEKYQKNRKKLFDRYHSCGRYVYDLAYQRYVIERYLDKINASEKKQHIKYYLVVLNCDYVYDGNTDESGRPKYKDEIVRFIDFTNITLEYQSLLDIHFKLVNNYLDNMKASVTLVGEHCERKKQTKCKFLNVCYQNISPKYSLFTYMFSHLGFKDEKGEIHYPFDLVNLGFTHLTDVPKEWLTRRNNQIQRKVYDEDKPYYHKRKIKDGLSLLKYPIYHLDFESFPCPLPRYRAEKAYSQSLFQFSIHVEREPGVCDKEKDHYEFLASNHEDLREELLKSMIEVIKNDGGSVLVYNISFERTRIKEMMEVYPHLANPLQNISNRLFDLMDLIKSNSQLYENLGYDKEVAKEVNFYDKRLYGSYSIKKVLPIFTDLSYDNLPVSNGTEALVTYAKFPQMTKEEFTQNYRDLLEYCKQDTWAMVEILRGLRVFVENED